MGAGWWSVLMEQELRRELVPSHPLYSRELKALARDDVLFTDGERFFIVDLAWGRGSGRFPHFSVPGRRVGLDRTGLF